MIKIQAIRKTVYPDLMEQYENPMEQPCNVQVGKYGFPKTAKNPRDFATAHGKPWLPLCGSWKTALQRLDEKSPLRHALLQ